MTGIVVIGFLSIIIYLLVQGFPYLLNPDFYSPDPNVEVSILPELYNTFYILLLSEIIIVPVSLAAAIYLVEYARQGLLVSIIHLAAETLAGVPAIVLGLFGYLVFSSLLGFGYSRLSGALTLLCLSLPFALRLFEEALTSVPRDLREGGLALGCTKWQVIRTIVLPSASPGIVTGIVISAGKVLAESAALIFTAGTLSPRHPYTLDPFIGGDTLTIHIWYVQTIGSGSYSSVDTPTAITEGSAALLIIVLLLINIGSRTIGRAIQRKVMAA
jgi:phosphate transport system permease protein